jgi:hypothetical protein
MYRTEDGRAGRRPHHGTSSGFDVTGALPAVAAGDPLPDEHSAPSQQYRLLTA